MWVLWDLVSLAVLVLLVFLGTRNGFVRTLINLLAYIIAAILALRLAPMIADWAYNQWLREVVTQTVYTALQEGLAQGAESLPQILESLPVWVAGLMAIYLPAFEGVDWGEFLKQGGREQISSAATALTTALEQPITQLLSWVIFTLLFLVLVLLIRLVARLFTSVNYLPVIGRVNMVFGGFLGAFQAVVVLLVLSVIINTVGVFMGGTNPLIHVEAVNSSLIMGSLYKIFY